MSIGDVLLLVFFLALFLYFAVGICVQIFVRKRSGINAVPNKDFWTALPGLIKDGSNFTYNRIFKRRSEGYQEITQ